jgi:putative endonuclease
VVRIHLPLLKESLTEKWGFFILKMYTVYVLYSQAHGKHYTGFTSDFEARFASHNLFGKKDWTTRYRPWKVILTESYEIKAEAVKREKWLKSGVGRDFIKTLQIGLISAAADGGSNPSPATLESLTEKWGFFILKMYTVYVLYSD